MPVTPATMETWCRNLLGDHPETTRRPLGDYLQAIPRLDSLADLPAGSVVLVRGDVDAKPGEKIGDGDIRLRSMVETLKFGRGHGWKQVIFGHIGRDPAGSLSKVRKRIEELMECPVTLVADWLDPDTLEIRPELTDAIAQTENGGLILLENTRKYDIERVLWKAKPADAPKLADPLSKLANAFAKSVGTAYVNEALSAGSLDASSTVLPAAMEKVAMGRYLAEEFDGPMTDCLAASLVVFSGLKIDKLDDLQAIVERGKVKMVIAAGSLAMALAKASARLDGKEFSMGVAEDPAHGDKPYYIPPARVDQAQSMIDAGRKEGVEFVLPADYVLADGSVSTTIGPGQQQLDVGPQASDLFAAKVEEFIAADAGSQPKVAFHNGVFGKFEDSQFEAGTRKFVEQLKRMSDAGVKVYVGGGEGGKALEKYGQEDWVTHVFTAGGTVLNALGGEPVPYLVALRMAAAGARF